jgi:hypothetical protein
MSRGLGKIESGVLSALYDCARSRQRRTRLIGLDTAAITARVYGKRYTHANAVSLQRALRTLEGKGAVERVGRVFSQHTNWRLRRR